MIPARVQALSLDGFILRGTGIGPIDILGLEAQSPGYVSRQLLATQGWIYDQLRKRYPVDTLGQSMGPPSGAGVNPPPLSFLGVPVRGDLELVISVTTPGAPGTAVLSWTDKSRATSPVSIGSAGLVSLVGTGVSIVCPSTGAFDISNVYTAATPCPEELLQWIADRVLPRLYARRGWNPTNDKAIDQIKELSDAVAVEIEKAVNSNTSLWDMPLNADTGGSGITQGGPLACGETSPYVWMDEQARRGRAEDRYR